MEFQKTSIRRMTMPYALGVVEMDGVTYVAGATEDHGPVVLVPPPFEKTVELSSGPGGCMALVGRPDRSDALYCIMGCFVGYDFHGGGIYEIAREGSRRQPEVDSWTTTRILDLPFAHRLGFVTMSDVLYMVAASIAQTKETPDDWERPGSLYVSAVPRSPDERWQLTPVLEGIHKHHGFQIGTDDGKSAVLVSGSEGIFAVSFEDSTAGWTAKRIVDREVSEFSYYDIDGDGAEELITIEPFHGNRLAVFRKNERGWTDLVWEDGLEYGHSLWTGLFRGERSVLVSNRTGEGELALYQFSGRSPGSASLHPKRFTVDHGIGAANVVVVRSNGADVILATNQTTSEIAKYAVS